MHSVFGIDEAGRGPLAGPVVAACVHIPADKLGLSFWEGVTDSKKLSAKKREHLFSFICENSIFGIAEASAQEIDALNIHHATLLAMTRAFEHCFSPPFIPPQAGGMSEGQKGSMVLVDGKFCPKLPCPAQAVVKGDSKHLEIAAASILAKVTRDRLMAELDGLFPVYGWAKNAGYGTAQHMSAIAEHGITEHHRTSFAPCAVMVKQA
jgi:ribonuclease HII